MRRTDGHLPDTAVRRLAGLHTALFRLTGGRLGRRLVDNDMLLLTTIGRHTRRRHTVPLLYLREGDAFVVFASYGGRHHHPDWYRNLQTMPCAEVRIRRSRLAVRARTAEGRERHRLWQRALSAYAGYAAYQDRTARQIPVVVLEPEPP